MFSFSKIIVEMNYLILFIFVILLSRTLSYNILAIFPHPGRSQFLAFGNLLEALARKGHQVTVISYFPSKGKISNYSDIKISDIEPTQHETIVSRTDQYTVMYTVSLFIREIGKF